MPSTCIRSFSGGSTVLTLGKQFPPEPDSLISQAAKLARNVLNKNVLPERLSVSIGAKCAPQSWVIRWAGSIDSLGHKSKPERVPTHSIL
jgi:hypothetical protein